MPQLQVDTQSAAYQTRHQQFQDIVSFWMPQLRKYRRLPPAMRQAWRDNDPFLNDMLRLKERFTNWDFDE